VDFVVTVASRAPLPDMPQELKVESKCVGISRGRKAPNMSAGELHDVLATLFAIRTASIMTHVVPRLANQTDQQVVLRDWERGRQTLLFTLQVKLSPWQRLPLIICGGAHPDETLARSILARASTLFHEIEDPESHHPLARRFFDEGSPLLAEVLAFLNGQRGRLELPGLMFHLGKLSMVPIAERLVESVHAVLKKNIRLSPHHGVAHAALGLHTPDLTTMLDANSDFIREMARCCYAVRTPMRAIKELGFIWYIVARGGTSIKGFCKPGSDWVFHIVL
jgi:hypothetical protein